MTRSHHAAIALILALNLLIAAPLFPIEYSAHMGSIEAAYISISHQWMTHGWNPGWWPLWYGGVPGQNVYPPLLHAIVALWAIAARITPALSHHQVTALTYCLGPLAVYALAWTLSRRRWSAAAAALVYTVLSPSAFLMPAVRADIGGLWNARRLNTLVIYGEGPHVLSLALLPLAVVALWFALEKRKPWMLVAAGAALAATVLSNWLGAFGLAAAALCLLFARPARDWMIAVGLAVASYAAVSPLIPPSTLAAVRMNAQRIGGDFQVGIANLAMLVAILFLAWFVNRFIKDPLTRFAMAFTVIMGAITLAADRAAIFVLPQPLRYHLEMEIGIALLAGAWIRTRLALALLAAAAIFPAVHAYGYARSIIRPIDIRQTSEYKVARWLDQNLQHARVMAPGSVSFWLNAFTDTPQLGGGFDQGIVNPVLPGAHYQILSGMGAGDREGQVAADWLRAFGVAAVAVSGPGSSEVYQPFANPGKFEGVLPLLWRDGGDAIYSTGLRSPSLARVVPRGAIVEKPPVYANDTSSMKPFLDALADPALPVARWEQIDRSHFRARVRLSPEHAVSIAITHHPGWSATVNGTPAAIRRDGLGLMVIEPLLEGDAEIDLRYRLHW